MQSLAILGMGILPPFFSVGMLSKKRNMILGAPGRKQVAWRPNDLEKENQQLLERFGQEHYSGRGRRRDGLRFIAQPCTSSVRQGYIYLITIPSLRDRVCSVCHGKKADYLAPATLALLRHGGPRWLGQSPWEKLCRVIGLQGSYRWPGTSRRHRAWGSGYIDRRR